MSRPKTNFHFRLREILISGKAKLYRNLEDLSKSVAPAARSDSSHGSRDCWIITGEFVDMDAGNRALQAGVGFGAGQSHVDVRARVYALADMNTPFLTFDSKGASSHLPGAVVAKNPYVAAAKFVMSKREPEREAKKVAKDCRRDPKIHGRSGNPDSKVDGGHRRRVRDKPLAGTRSA